MPVAPVPPVVPVPLLPVPPGVVRLLVRPPVEPGLFRPPVSELPEPVAPPVLNGDVLCRLNGSVVPVEVSELLLLLPVPVPLVDDPVSLLPGKDPLPEPACASRTCWAAEAGAAAPASDIAKMTVRIIESS